MCKPFQFKQFTVHQDGCAMKIGTDSVLLGAWVSLENNPYSIMDIGAGTGVLSLMLAQRSQAEIVDAIEIDDKAYEQCTENFENSNWNDRLFCYHASLQEFAEEIEDKYDLIISNPPFYKEDYKTNNNQRDLARFQDALPFNHLIESVAKLLSNEGLFSVIIPFTEKEEFIKLAFSQKLFPSKITDVKGNTHSDFVRSLMTFSFTKQTLIETQLIIETSRHEYTNDYINLTKDFYLKM